MTQRITIKDIQNRLDYLNDLTGHEREPYGPREEPFTCNPNSLVYHLSQAYGGCRIEQMCKTGTGTSTVTQGYESKRVCYEQLNAFIDGVKVGVS